MIRVLLAAVAFASATASPAAIMFSGALTNDTPPPGPSPLCAAGQVRVAFSPTTSAQTSSSNFGGFGFTQAHCLTPGAPSYDGGVFQFAFDAGDVLTGSYAGLFTPTATTGVVNSTVNFLVTGGTGRFDGATGMIQGVGTLDRTVPRPFNSLALNGTLDVAAVPEPASWAMMICGFTLAGGILRRRRFACQAGQGALPAERTELEGLDALRLDGRCTGSQTSAG